jgi:hypothetical protein
MLRVLIGGIAAIGMTLLSSWADAQATLTPNWLYSSVSSVQAVAYSPNGKWLAVGGAGGIQIYN